MHENNDFNIVQTGHWTDAKMWGVIHGKRTASGNIPFGAEIMRTNMTRAEAIEYADALQKSHDTSK